MRQNEITNDQKGCSYLAKSQKYETGFIDDFKPSQIEKIGEAMNKTRSPSKKSYEIYVNDFET